MVSCVQYSTSYLESSEEADVKCFKKIGAIMDKEIMLPWQKAKWKTWVWEMLSKFKEMLKRKLNNLKIFPPHSQRIAKR